MARLTENHETADPELLVEHRELQLLRAAGVSASHRRSKRRNRSMKGAAGQAELQDWVGSRGRLLDEAHAVRARAS